MENQHTRDVRPSQQEICGNGLTHGISDRINHQRRPCNSSNQQNLGEKGKFPQSGTYGLPMPMVFDPLLYPSIPRTILPLSQYHPGVSAQTGYQSSLAGLNQINPVYLLSSNDNNNCNRSRAASHSTAMEIQHHSLLRPSHLSFTPYPAYIPNPYFNIRHGLNPDSGTSSTIHRRNSTSTLPQTQEIYPAHDMALTSGVPLPAYPRTQIPYTGASHQNLFPPHVTGYYTKPVAIRRDRYSTGGPLMTTGGTSIQASIHRRNSIPTALEVQHISEESTENSSSVDDDDDDVFDSSPPLTAPHSATDAASYLEQLRESRKRALSGTARSSEAKFLCRDDSLPRARFRHRVVDVDDESNASDDQKSQKRIRVINNQPIDVPSTSKSQHNEDTSGTRHERQTENTTENTIHTVTKDSAQASSSQSASRADTPPPHPKLLQKQPQPASASRSASPNPGILKKSRIRINRDRMTHLQEGKDESSQSAKSATSEMPRTKSLPIKKQVAWKDVPKITQASRTDNDIIISPMKHDLLSEKNLLQIKKNLKAFTSKDKIGPYVFGPRIGSSPVHSITQFLVRKENTFKYYMAKVLNLGGRSADEKSGRMLLYSEHSLLTLLKNHPGVVREHGFYKDLAYNPKTEQVHERLCLVIDCLTPHEFDHATEDYLNLQQHVIKVKRLTERETIRIFMSIVDVVHSLHELNVVHRDLKLGNMILLKKSQKVVLTNFCLGRHLMSDGELLKDQRGSPAYISPDVLSSKPYAGKPSDMWSLGVVLFMMLYGQFPFYDQEPPKLFRKIKKADFTIPGNVRTSTEINDVIRGLLTLDLARRLTSGQTLLALQQLVNSWNLHRYSPRALQVVPDLDNEKDSSSDSDDDRMEETEEYLDEKLTQEFRMKLMNKDEDTNTTDARFGRVTYQSTLPTIQHCPYDARPLTQEEIAMHHQLLNSSMNVRVQGSS